MKRLILISMAALGTFLPLISRAAYAVDATGTIANVNGVSNTVSVTIPATSNRVFKLAALSDSNNANELSATLGGQALTFVYDVPWPGGPVYVDGAYLLNPPTGTNNLVITAAHTTDIQGSWASYSGLAQSAPEATSTCSGNGASASCSVTTLTANDLVVMGFFPGTNFNTYTGSTTLRSCWDGNACGTSGGIYDANGPVPVGAISFGGTISASNKWSGGMMAFKPLASASAAPTTTDVSFRSGVIINKSSSSAPVNTALVQYSTSTSSTVYLPNVKAGNALILATGWNFNGGSGASISSCTDTQGDTYTTSSVLDPPSPGAAICWATNVAGGNTTTTVVLSSNSTTFNSLNEFSGIALSNALDVPLKNVTGTVSGSDNATSNATTTNFADLVFGLYLSNNVVPSTSPGTGQTAITSLGLGNQGGISTEYYVQSAPGIASSTFTVASSSRIYTVMMGTFKTRTSPGGSSGSVLIR